MDVRLPDGTLIRDVPEGTSKRELADKLTRNGFTVPPEWMTPNGAASPNRESSGPTLQQLEQALVNADRAGDEDAARRLAAAVVAARKSQQANAPAPGFIERVQEAVTGARRSTEQTETLPDWATMPELNSFSAASFKTGLGTLLSNPQETVQIIKANFPGVQVGQDEKGNFLLTSSIDGRQYAIKPGFQLSDVPRAAGAVAAFTPAGRALTLPRMAAGAGVTQAAIEASQAATGGEFNPGEVGMAALLAPVVPAAVNVARAVAAPMAAPVKAGASRLLRRPVAESSAESSTVSVDASRPASPIQEMADMLNYASPAKAVNRAEELALTARRAADGGIGSGRAVRTLAEQSAPDAKTVEAARRLGVEEFLQPDHVTTNQAYRELAQAVKSVPGSTTRQAELQGLEQVAKRADDLISEVGGTTDVSSLNSTLRARMQATVSELEAKSDDLYRQIRERLPPQTAAPASNVLAFIEQRARDLGGAKNLTALEKTIRARLAPRAGEPGAMPAGSVSPSQLRAEVEASSQRGAMVGQGPRLAAPQRVSQPTYALLDDVRKDVGAATRNQGPFKDADIGLAKQLYSLLSEDQGAIVGAAGLDDLFNAARQSVGVRKSLEDDMVALFGKQLDRSVAGELSNAMGSAAKGDSDKLVKLLQAVPPNMRQNVVASGLNSVFAKNSRSGALNFGSYANWFEGLMRNKQAYSAVMSNLPQPARKQLSDLYRVSKGISQATRERITTGRIQAVQQELQGVDTLMAKIYAVARRAAVVVPAEAAATAAGLPGAGIAAGLASALTRGKTNPLKAADALISSPEFIQAARASTGAKPQLAARRLSVSKSFRAFVQAVGAPRELADRERWVMQALQGQHNAAEQRH